MRESLFNIRALVVFVSISSTLAKKAKKGDAPCNGTPCRKDCCNVMQYCSIWDICQSCEGICDKQNLIRFWTYKKKYCEEKCSGYLARVFLRELRTTRSPALNSTHSPTQKPCDDSFSPVLVWSLLSIILVFMAVSLTLFLMFAKRNLRKRQRTCEVEVGWALQEPLVPARRCRPSHIEVSDLGYLRQDPEETYTAELISSYIRQSEQSRISTTPRTLLDIEESGSFDNADQAVEKQHQESGRQDTPGAETESRIPKSRDLLELELSRPDSWNIYTNENAHLTAESISVESHNFQPSRSSKMIPTVLQDFEPDGCGPHQPLASASRHQATPFGNVLVPRAQKRPDLVRDLSPSSPSLRGHNSHDSRPNDFAYCESIDTFHTLRP